MTGQRIHMIKCRLEAIARSYADDLLPVKHPQESKGGMQMNLKTHVIL
jgi:hypothetical protein